MAYSAKDLTLSADDKIDLQLHTVHSDGSWTAEDLLDYLIVNEFSLAAITDHDRVDMAKPFQKLAIEKGFPLLVAVEMSSMWKDKLTDFLCYGFDPEDNALDALARDVANRQYENTRQVCEELRKKGLAITDEELQTALAKPSTKQVDELVSWANKYKQDDTPLAQLLFGAGFAYMTQEPAKIVAAAHKSNAVCILAHPGRDDGFITYDIDLLDELREEAPVDGIEAHYPKHSEEQTQMYLDYAQKHDLFVSSGSDSHAIDNPPIKYEAKLSQKLLKHLGVNFAS